jgi:hypothetical protein
LLLTRSFVPSWLALEMIVCITSLRHTATKKRQYEPGPLLLRQKRSAKTETLYPSGGMRRVNRGTDGGLVPTGVESKHERGLVNR